MSGVGNDLQSTVQTVASGLLALIGGVICLLAVVSAGVVFVASDSIVEFFGVACCWSWMLLPAPVMLGFGLMGLRDVRWDSYQSTVGGVVDRDPEPPDL